MPTGGPIQMSKDAIERSGCMEETQTCAMLSLCSGLDEHGWRVNVYCCVSELELGASCAKRMIPFVEGKPLFYKRSKKMPEANWPEGIRKSREVIVHPPRVLGDIMVEGPRPHICAHCGASNVPMYHIKPETYAFEYGGLTLYLEVHLCEICKKKWEDSDGAEG